MITIFNRKEVLFTNDLEKFNLAQYALMENKIEYATAAKDPFRNLEQVRTGSAGIKPIIEYKLFVHKKDAEYAEHVIQKKFQAIR